MKIRNSFVSNSSSSSFIVAFKEKPKSKEELKQLLFGDRKLYLNPYCDLYKNEEDQYWDCQIVADIVWEDLQKLSPMKFNEALETVNSGWFEGHPDYNYNDCPSFSKDPKGYEKFLDEHRKETEKAGLEYLIKFLKELCTELNIDPKKIKKSMKRLPKEIKLYGFSYSDNDGTLRSSMEHGSLFDRVKHLKISNH